MYTIEKASKPHPYDVEGNRGATQFVTLKNQSGSILEVHASFPEGKAQFSVGDTVNGEAKEYNGVVKTTGNGVPKWKLSLANGSAATASTSSTGSFAPTASSNAIGVEEFVRVYKVFAAEFEAVFGGDQSDGWVTTGVMSYLKKQVQVDPPADVAALVEDVKEAFPGAEVVDPEEMPPPPSDSDLVPF